MSADNWTVCPKCWNEGRVLRMTDLEPYAELPPTMREDYEIGLDEEGDFTVSYRCYCKTCKFIWRFSYSCKVPL